IDPLNPRCGPRVKSGTLLRNERCAIWALRATQGAWPVTAMLRKIDRDVKRFKQIVRGVIKKDFRKYLTQGELIGRQGKHIVSIPLPQIEIPRIRFGSKATGGVGQGEGEAGDALDGEPGLDEGQHILEVEVGLDELATIL